MTNIIDGKTLSDKVYEELEIKISNLLEIGRGPQLKIILVGDKKDSLVYTEL